MEQLFPKDSQQVGATWKYVNVKGGPDKRFKNNPQLPVMLYGRLGFASASGLNILGDCSIPTAAAQLARSASSYAAPPQLQKWAGSGQDTERNLHCLRLPVSCSQLLP
ncbi:hypothetical protein ACIRVF_28805 [Kitasatospora sp. NPDC101157]|uniref:hypothetical protein n=1 Tax=Kitasatospora sp. NPDC101157 TaxID=3364098 RepID=UPI003805ED2B